MIAIDIGNSRIKWAQLRAGSLVCHGVGDYKANTLWIALDKLQIPLHQESVVVSLVAGDSDRRQLVQYLATQGCASVQYARSQRDQMGLVSAYDDAACLGVDRWVAMIAAFHHPSRQEGEAVCVIDAGTAVTLDVIGHDGQHLGGLIMPGYRSMIAGLVSDTARLEVPRLDDDECSGLARDTGRAMTLGVKRLLSSGLSAMIEAEQRKLAVPLRVFVTGGDGEWLSVCIGQPCEYDPWLVMKGLELTASQTEADN